ncbi:eukaryotic translation initiation factor 4E-binding protein Mextli isoform X11 [Aphidius gifuensis]|uniref:eukaryotic translation initiation factor 4E-binding protein Mextli isoform X11 n=1 Tax=Aphidius gifuensis TaxID=684658 RepID=UPI001CDC59EF|nr:eukaryotic translation initiation factor 4E-binding protein Mextli isoform X11 [Aphidius gifuensis]
MASTQVSPRPRTTKKLEKPRVLKLNQRNSAIDGRITTEDFVSLIDEVVSSLSNGCFDPTLQINILTMCETLKNCPHQIETIYKDQLDRAFVAIRNASQNDKLDLTTRVHLLELIELRAKQWRRSDSMDAYYSQKLANLDENDVCIMESPTTPLGSSMMGLPSPQTAPVLGVGDVMKNSGKFTKPTRIPGKNYCKDEVVIRNSDSGKVSPGAKERLVQITGSSEDKIHYAKDLIKDTIQRNASPVCEHGAVDKSGIGGSSSSLNSSASDESNRLHHQPQQQQQQLTTRPRATLLHSFSTNDASIGEYKYTVTIGNQSLKITGANLDLVRTAKLVLEDHFRDPMAVCNIGFEHFTLEEESGFPSPISGPIKPVPVNTMEKKIVGDVETTFKIQPPIDSPKKTNDTRSLVRTGNVPDENSSSRKRHGVANK